MKQAHGWSLLELIAVLSLISLLMLSGVSSLNNHINRAQSVRASDLIIKALTLTREEAIARKKVITFCGIMNNKCSKTTNSDIVVFIDENRNRKIDQKEEIIRFFSLSKKNDLIILKASFGRQYFRFKENGSIMESGSILFCPKYKPETFGQVIKLNYSGRMYLLNNNKAKKAQLKCLS